MLVTRLLAVSVLVACSFTTTVSAAVQAPERTEARIYVPDNYTPDQKWPVIVLMHGFTASGEWVNFYFRLRQYVTERGFILIVPNGVRNSRGDRYWNATDACCDFEHTGVNDVAYINGLIDDVAKRYSVDENRIYAAGHSNGGFMAHRLACEPSNRFAAIVSLAGVTFKDASNCKSTRPVSLLQIHAVDDETILFEGNKGYPGLGDYPGAHATVDLWVGRNRCVGTLEDAEDFNLTNSIPGVDTKVSRWSQCQQKTDVELWTIRPYKSRWHTAHVPRLADSFAPRVLDFLLSHSLNVGPAKRP